jgi:threonyl-tRNA synthetase
MVVIGKREHTAENISLRSAREGDLGNSSIDDFVKRLTEEVESRE